MSLNQLIDTSNVAYRKWLNVKVNSLNILEELKFANTAGTDGQIISNVDGLPFWTLIQPVHFQPGDPDTFLHTNTNQDVEWFNMTNYLSSYFIDSGVNFGTSGSYSPLTISGSQYISGVVSFNFGTQAFTILKAGVYDVSISFQIVQDLSPRGQIKINILKNSVDLFPNNYVTSESGIDTHFYHNFAVNDVIEFQQAGIGLLAPQSVYDEISYIAFRFIG